MRIRMPVTGQILYFLVVWASFTGTCSAEATPVGGGSVEGFGKLTWGISVELAEKAYPDLYFGGYEIVNRKEEPVKIYYRKATPGKMDGVVFDSYEYCFKRNGFFKVRASLNSKIGPRTLITRAETSWEKMVEYLRRKYGEPKEHRTDYVTENLAVVKEMRWDAGGVFLRLIYKGPERTNEDQLIFEMGK